MSATITRAPSCAKPRVMARPRLDAPPVTMTTRPVSPRSMRLEVWRILVERCVPRKRDLWRERIRCVLRKTHRLGDVGRDDQTLGICPPALVPGARARDQRQPRRTARGEKTRRMGVERNRRAGGDPEVGGTSVGPRDTDHIAWTKQP